MRVSSHQYIEDQFPRKLSLTVFEFEGVFTPGPRVTASGYKMDKYRDSDISYPLPTPQETTMRSLSYDVEAAKQLPVVTGRAQAEPQGLSPQ